MFKKSNSGRSIARSSYLVHSEPHISLRPLDHSLDVSLIGAHHVAGGGAAEQEAQQMEQLHRRGRDPHCKDLSSKKEKKKETFLFSQLYTRTLLARQGFFLGQI